MSDVQKTIDGALGSFDPSSAPKVFLVACGGSLSIMYAGKYFLDRHSRSISTEVCNGEEFVVADTLKSMPNSLVILCSQTGTTKETVRAAEYAKNQGVVAIVMSTDLDSPLGKASEFGCAYQAGYSTGAKIDAANSNYSVLYQLAAGILKKFDDVDVIEALEGSLSALQTVIDKAQVQYATKLDGYAEVLANKSVIYTLASGPNYGAAYSYAICVMMEMQWINSQAIHANEFFHGPFEVVDKDAAFVVLVGLDETRPLALRALRFLHEHGSKENILTMDGADLDMSGIADQFKAYFAPLVFFDVLWKFTYQIAEIRSHPMLTGRRYMKKISNY